MAVNDLIIADLSTNLYTDTVANNSAKTVKGSSTTVVQIEIDNTLNAVSSFIKLYNTTGVVTVGTTVPDEIIHVAATSKVNVVYPKGHVFNVGLKQACVTTGGTTGTTSPSSNVTLEIVYS